jgi:hypothetical protein
MALFAGVVSAEESPIHPNNIEFMRRLIGPTTIASAQPAPTEPKKAEESSSSTWGALIVIGLVVGATLLAIHDKNKPKLRPVPLPFPIPVPSRPSGDNGAKWGVIIGIGLLLFTLYSCSSKSSDKPKPEEKTTHVPPRK